MKEEELVEVKEKELFEVEEDNHGESAAEIVKDIENQVTKVFGCRRKKFQEEGAPRILGYFIQQKKSQKCTLTLQQVL